LLQLFGIVPASWEITGSFSFENQEDLEFFKENLKKTWEEYCDGKCVVMTMEELNKLENEYYQNDDTFLQNKESTLKTIYNYINLKKGWDGHDAIQITDIAISKTISLINKLPDDFLKKLTTTEPMIDGGIKILFNDNTFLNVRPDGMIFTEINEPININNLYNLITK
jgi:hypothetical protein